MDLVSEMYNISQGIIDGNELLQEDEIEEPIKYNINYCIKYSKNLDKFYSLNNYENE